MMAQPIISKTYFPNAGDKLAMAVASDNATKLLSITPSDENQTWNYAFLDSVNTTVEKYETASAAIKQDFPDADMVGIYEGQEAIYNKTDERFEILALKNYNARHITINTFVKPDNPLLLRRADLTYISVNNNRSVSVVTLSPAQFPDSLVNRLPIRPDSVRITIVNTRQDYVDAWGNLTIPRGSYNVLRVRCIEIVEQKIEVKINNAWTDATPQYFNGNPSPQDTFINYQFWADGVKTPILRLTLNPKYEITKAEYRIEPPQTVAISGVIKFWKNIPMRNVKIKIGSDSTLTDANGQYRFEAIEADRNFTVTITKSDSYENGVDAVDLILLRRHIVGITDITAQFQLFAGDIDGNNDLDAIDYLYIKRLIVGVISAYPQTPTWRFISNETAQDTRFPTRLMEGFLLQKTFTTPLSNFDFVGFKKGDIDGSADVGN
jgi:hypothetical protein